MIQEILPGDGTQAMAAILELFEGQLHLRPGLTGGLAEDMAA
jgi:hypothetical protein